MTQKTLVIAHYPDGTTRDVTREAVLTSSMPETATVKPTGEITAIRRGEAALLVRYEGTYADHAPDRAGRPQGLSVGQARRNSTTLTAWWTRNCRRSRRCRRVCATMPRSCAASRIDLTGLPPTPEQARAFLDDKTPSQAEAREMVDALLGSPAYTDRWTNKWADLLDCQQQVSGRQGRSQVPQLDTRRRREKHALRQVRARDDDRVRRRYENAPANYLRVVRDTVDRDGKRHAALPGRSLLVQQVPRSPVRAVDAEPVLSVWRVLRAGQFQAGTAGGRRGGLRQSGRRGDAPQDRTWPLRPSVPVGHLARTADFRPEPSAATPLPTGSHPRTTRSSPARW